ncbi:MAG: acyltransferase, partial [Methanobrevibacter sp.]|nr:acyltransferase [Methanobrevibacter sp.]
MNLSCLGDVGTFVQYYYKNRVIQRLNITNNIYHNMKNPTRRIYYYDFIRAFAIFGVLACHCFAGSVVNVDLFNTRFWYYSLFLNSLRLVSVPLFIVVSGALLIGKKDSIRVFIKKRFNKVIIPYIFWVIMYILFLIFYRHFNVGKAVFSTISIPPTAGVFFWFVQMIIVVYLIILILNKLIEYNKLLEDKKKMFEDFKQKFSANQLSNENLKNKEIEKAKMYFEQQKNNILFREQIFNQQKQNI